MKNERITFTNALGQELSARIALPVDRRPQHFALFAHCFTCNKDLHAVRNISRALTSKGFGVMRFDFTGLGESEGEHAETTFSSNIGDLHAAAAALAEAYQAPSLLIGHSLGGAAMIVAAAEMASVQAVATIGAPADIGHVKHMFKDQLERIRENGSAEVSIGGRPFTIRQEFIDDLERRDLQAIVKDLRKPLLIAHSPQDTIVGIANAADLYHAAMHPKSFLSLDGADHLLSDKADSLYTGDVIAAWVKRYIARPGAEDLELRDLPVIARLGEERYTTQVRVGRHHLVADEPAEVGGDDLGPSPYGLVTAGLGACTAMTMRMYAERKGWDLREVTVHLSHAKTHAADSAEDARGGTRKIDRFVRRIQMTGTLDTDQRARLMDIADRCPVHRTLHETVEIETSELKE